MIAARPDAEADADARSDRRARCSARIAFAALFAGALLPFAARPLGRPRAADPVAAAASATSMHGPRGVSIAASALHAGGAHEARDEAVGAALLREAVAFLSPAPDGSTGAAEASALAASFARLDGLRALSVAREHRQWRGDHLLYRERTESVLEWSAAGLLFGRVAVPAPENRESPLPADVAYVLGADARACKFAGPNKLDTPFHEQEARLVVLGEAFLLLAPWIVARAEGPVVFRGETELRTREPARVVSAYRPGEPGGWFDERPRTRTLLELDAAVPEPFDAAAGARVTLFVERSPAGCAVVRMRCQALWIVGFGDAPVDFEFAAFAERGGLRVPAAVFASLGPDGARIADDAIALRDVRIESPR